MTILRIMLEVILFPIRLILLLLVYMYKVLISPLLPKSCRFYPTCSTYMILAIKEWGLLRGGWLGVRRIVRCRPGGKCGYDFVPQNVKGELKWIY